MNDASTQILILLVELYAAFGLMLVGFGYMVAGKSGGGRVADFYFGGSLRWTLRHLRALLVGVLTTVWAALVAVLAGIGRAIRWLGRQLRARPRQARATPSQPWRFWEPVKRLLAGVEQWRRHYLGMHSLAFLLLLFCVVAAVFLVCLVLLLGS